MDRFKARLSSSCVGAMAFSLLVALVAVIDSTYSIAAYTQSTNLKFNSVLASQIYGATFSDASPAFDDIYIIKTRDKERVIIIYCNSTYCYKNRNGPMTA